MNCIIYGTKIMYDVPTKCTTVNNVLTSKFSSKKAIDSHIKTQAKSLGVNPVTIKAWIAKYAHTHEVGMGLPPGTMRHDFLVVSGTKNVRVVRTKLKKVRLKIRAINEEHTSTHTSISPDKLRTKPPPGEILEELLNVKKG